MNVTRTGYKNYGNGISQPTMTFTKIFLMKNNVTIIPLIMFYDHMKEIMFKALGPVIYTIQDKFIYIDDLCLNQ